MTRKNNIPIIGDNGSSWMHKAIQNIDLDYMSKLEEYKKDIIKNTMNDTSTVSVYNLKSLDSKVNFIKTYLNIIEKMLQNILKGYSIYEMIYWSRRIAPLNIHEAEHLTVRLYREVLNIAIFKYCSEDKTYRHTPDGGLVPQTVPDFSINAEIPKNVLISIIDAYNIEILCYLYVLGTQIYRMVNKGGSIKHKEEDGFNFFMAQASPKTWNLVSLYDERRKYLDLLSTVKGIAGDVKVLKAKINSEPIVPVFLLNVDFSYNPNVDIPSGETIISCFPFGGSNNYIVDFISLNQYYEHLLIFNDDFFNKYDISVAEFVSFFYCILLYLLNSNDTDKTVFTRLSRTAYKTIKLDGYIEQLSPFFKQAYKNLTNCEHSNIEDICKKIISLLSLDKNNANHEIDLWTRGPRNIYFKICENYYVEDLSGIDNVLRFILHDIARKDGTTGKKSGDTFEKEVTSKISEKYGQDKIWVHHREIKNLNNKKKEIDSSLIIGEFLFIIECKAVNVSFAFDRGDKIAIDQSGPLCQDNFFRNFK
jgi:hypothetical protein